MSSPAHLDENSAENARHSGEDAGPMLTPSQLARVALLGNADHTAIKREVRHLPTDVYVSEERFKLEMKKLFSGRPVPVAVSAVLPEPLMHVAIDDYPMPILLTRDEDGHAHAFVNVCRHRSIKLCQSDQVQSGRMIVCPYHAWSYGLKGQLRGLPRAEIFPGLDKGALGLIPLQCEEAGGLIWVNPDPHSRADFSSVSGELAADLDAIGLSKQHLYRSDSVELKANWKLAHDAFLENYHIPRLHSESLKNMFVDRATVTDQIGPHLRLLSGRAHYQAGSDLRLFHEFRKHAVFAYVLLGGCIIITSPSYVSVMLFAPQAPDRTKVKYYMLVDKPPATAKAIDHYERSWALMMRLTTEEDFRVSALGQIGATSRAMPTMIMGGMEQDVVRFHEIIEAEMSR